MEENTEIKQKRVRFRNRGKWFKLFLIGIITYIFGLVILVITGNPNLFPAVVMLGNFLVPVTYVSFFYEKRHLSNVNMAHTIGSFFYGGFVGTFAAAILEPIFIHTLNFRDAMVVGVIEEFAKILGVLLIFKRRRHHLEMDGIILGAAAGMGFAALESSGYAFTTFLRSGGNLSLTVYITLLRGILSPLGHGTWTAILAGVLLRESGLSNIKINVKVIYAYFVVVILHGFWDGLAQIVSIFIPVETAILIVEFGVGLMSILILRRLWSEAKQQAIEHSSGQ